MNRDLHLGWIALDIDGTVTDHTHHIPIAVADALAGLHEKGWSIIFLTGRAFSFAWKALGSLRFPYHLGVQNGADLLEMPSRTLLSRSYLPGRLVIDLKEQYGQEIGDFIVYAGYEKGDFCYYRPKHLSAASLEYVERIRPLSAEPWKIVDHFIFSEEDSFPLIKCLGNQVEMEKLNGILQRNSSVSATYIRDPLQEGLYLNLITAPEATKGAALKRMIQLTGKRGIVIAGGDDRNDMSMLEKADVKIVINTAPSCVQALADIIALPIEELGIIKALEEATHAP